MSNDAPYPRVGGCSGFQVTGMIEWSKNQNPQKSPRHKLTPKQSHAKFPSHKSFQKALNELIWKIETLEIKCCVCLFSIIPYEVITNLHIVLYTRTNTCQIFLPKQIPGIKNFKAPKTLRSSPSLEIRSTALPTWSPLCECEIKIDHYAGDYNHYSLRLVCGFL